MKLSILFNLGSLILGLAAWVIPVIAILRRKRGDHRFGCSMVSFMACAVSLTLQIFEVRNRVHLEDWSALMDTIGAVSMAAVVLVAVTVIINAAALGARKMGGTTIG